MQAKTIDEVIAFLEQIIDTETTASSKLAYFAVLYHKVTVRIKEGIENREFEDNSRMERLDVIFANRYLEAYRQFKNGDTPSACWEVAFKAAPWFWPIVLQHLLVGMNAHINLDLGIAAAEISPGYDIIKLKKDFDHINVILGSMIEGVQQDINQVSPIIGLLDAVAGKFDERLADFSINLARDGAWLFAENYALATDEEKKELFKKRDKSIAWLGRDLRKPGFVFGLFAKFVRLFEWASVKRVVDVLKVNT